MLHLIHPKKKNQEGKRGNVEVKRVLPLVWITGSAVTDIYSVLIFPSSEESLSQPRCLTDMYLKIKIYFQIPLAMGAGLIEGLINMHNPCLPVCFFLAGAHSVGTP